ncbi:type IV pilus biogenesis protein PilP [Pantoea ananatis]|uniref:type IV pilus biogenesis protein PilP n=1 Tax=Pantoea ananas TaxID=553 RepID=UPI000697C06C|nr:type IV pilus biogenesis protein PilP [Pantoea ananatis]
MQINNWRYLLPVLLVTCQFAMANQQTVNSPDVHKSALSSVEQPVETAKSQATSLPDTTAHDNSMGRLEDIQAKTMIFEFQLAQAKALNELQKNGYDASLGAPFNPQPIVSVKDKNEPRPAQESKALPQIVEISGGRQLSATLQLDGGNQIRVQTGSRVPGTTWTVAKITLSEVTVSSPDAGLVSLAFSG